jgi:mono/diheme cytochrome c family protein
MRTGLLACAMALAQDASGADRGDPRARGRELFAHRCGMCHSEGGTGTFTLERRLGRERALLEGRADLQPGYVRYVVRWGLVNMPRISRVELSDTELDAVIAYLTATSPR